MKENFENKDTNFNAVIKKIFEYKPLLIILIVSFILAAVQERYNTYMTRNTMTFFMAHFFILLSLFKFFDLKGFAQGFSSYDLIAKKFYFYAYCYPFLEFILGLWYLGAGMFITLSLCTLILMLISGLGVLNTLVSGKNFSCACLGTTLKVPLSTVSVVENFAMALMAGYQLFYFVS